MCWIFHLVGDLHQPLHSTALFSERGFPTGDRGGNSVKFTTLGNLHSFCDSRAGTGKSLSFLSKKVNDWVADQNLATLGEAASQDTNIENWFKESYNALPENLYTIVSFSKRYQSKKQNFMGKIRLKRERLKFL